jgi:hypothetical protein
LGYEIHKSDGKLGARCNLQSANPAPGGKDGTNSAFCDVAGCLRATWNGCVGEQCCHTCKASGGTSHGPDCETKAAAAAAAAAPLIPACSSAKRRHWISVLVVFMAITCGVVAAHLTVLQEKGIKAVVAAMGGRGGHAECRRRDAGRCRASPSMPTPDRRSGRRAGSGWWWRRWKSTGGTQGCRRRDAGR